MLKKVATDKAPAAIGPYSQGIIADKMLFASGQIPIDPATGEITGENITQQAEQVMKNVGEILKAAGTNYENVVKTTCFLRKWLISQRLMRCMRNILRKNRQEAVLR